MITNQQVYDALTSEITERWNLHAESEDGVDAAAKDCLLCNLFNKFNKKCRGCPLLLETGLTCYDEQGDDLYGTWACADPGPTKRRYAKQMLNLLIKIREKYFGDWK